MRVVSVGSGVVLCAALLSAIVAAPAAAQELAVYFDPEGTVMVSHGEPSPFVLFDTYIFLRNADRYVTAVEYRLLTPADPSHVLYFFIGIEFPDGAVIYMGDPFSGHSIAFWPPLNGFDPGYNLICTISCFMTDICASFGGSLMDFPIAIGPHPDSGALRGTFYPDNEFFEITGLTSYLCPSHWPPYITDVEVVSYSSIEVRFSPCVDSWTGEDPERYRVYDAADPADTMAISSAVRDEVYGYVTLSFDRPMTDGTEYVLEAHVCCECNGCGESSFTFVFDSAVPTLLQGWAAAADESGIELTWRLSGILGDAAFAVERMTGERAEYGPLDRSGVEADGSSYRYRDGSVEPGGRYRYRVQFDGREGAASRVLFETGWVEALSLPLRLLQNRPNPFNPSTRIGYYLPGDARVRLEIYDVSGRLVRTLIDGHRRGGPGEAEWDGRDMAGAEAASGIYFYSLRAGRETITRKMVLLR